MLSSAAADKRSTFFSENNPEAQVFCHWEQRLGATRQTAAISVRPPVLIGILVFFSSHSFRAEGDSHWERWRDLEVSAQGRVFSVNLCLHQRLWHTHTLITLAYIELLMKMVLLCFPLDISGKCGSPRNSWILLTVRDTHTHTGTEPTPASCSKILIFNWLQSGQII